MSPRWKSAIDQVTLAHSDRGDGYCKTCRDSALDMGHTSHYPVKWPCLYATALRQAFEQGKREGQARRKKMEQR